MPCMLQEVTHIFTSSTHEMHSNNCMMMDALKGVSKCNTSKAILYSCPSSDDLTRGITNHEDLHAWRSQALRCRVLQMLSATKHTAKRNAICPFTVKVLMKPTYSQCSNQADGIYELIREQQDQGVLTW